LKFPLVAAAIIGFASLMGGCKKTTENITQGTDSVYSSGWFAPTLSVTTDQFGDTSYEALVTNAALTSSVVSNGVVLAYIGAVGNLTSSTSQDTVAELATDYGVYTTVQVGTLLVQSLPTDDGGIGDFPQYGFFYRYVIIPGSVLATTGLTPQELKSMSFTEVTQALGKAKKSGSAAIQ